MPLQTGECIPSQPHYAYVTRSAIRLFNAGLLTNVTDIDVEPDYGYTTRLTYDDSSHRITYGNDLGLNPGAACDLAKDKGHAKFMLRTIGVNTPKGTELLLPSWADRIRASQAQKGNQSLRTTDQGVEYIESELGFPCYIKPVSGSKGLGVERVETPAETDRVFAAYDADRVRVAIIEQAVPFPDYRIVVLDNELISAYRRIPLTVVGSGRQTIAELIAEKQATYIAEGRDTVLDPQDARIAARLGKLGISLASVLPDKEGLSLMSISNLSAGGTSVDVTDQLHPRWAELAGYIARNFNLRICGVDLACADIRVAEADYSVLEVNASPGLDHYASSGKEQQSIVDGLYTKVLNAYPSM